MRPCLTLLALPALAALLACAPKAPTATPVTTTHTRNAPAWIDGADSPDGLGAVGIASPNPLGDKAMQRATALADARTQLAGKVRVRVQNMFSRLDQSVATASADGRKPLKTDVMNRVIETVTRQLIDQDLAGTRTCGTWTDPQDGTLYLLVNMTRESLDQALTGAAQGAIQKEIAQGERSLETALTKLDAAVTASK